MQNELVFTKTDKVYSTSLIFAQNFDIPHKDILKKIKYLTAESIAVKDMFISTLYKNERNREYPVYYLNRDGFMFLVMNINAKRTNEIKLKFIQAFNFMEQALKNHSTASWLEARELGKEQRKLTTDVIQEFVEYATTQGSKNSKYYYSTFTNETYKALELLDKNKSTPIRDMFTILALCWLATAESVVQKALKEGMEQELHYKEIYQLAKQRLVEFSKLVTLPPVNRLMVGSDVAEVPLMVV